MDSTKKIIFIKEGKPSQLIIEISQKEVYDFLDGLLLKLTLNPNKIEQPIKFTVNDKERVIEFLKYKYSDYKVINRLIKFFNDLLKEEYIYIYPFNNEYEEWYDILKESLIYYNRGESDEMIALEIKEYIKIKQGIQEALDKLPYELQMIIPKQKVFIGESKKEKRNCIYCGGKIEDGVTSFKNIAHAIPEALGNVKFIQNEECDSCNNYFAINAEEDLCNFLVWKRLQHGLKGKNGYPIFQLFDGKYARFFNSEKEDYNADWGHFNSIKSFIKEKNIKGVVIISTKPVDIKEDNNIRYIKNFVPQHVYKTLVKCVIGLIGNENLKDFSKTIDWLISKDEYIELPKVALIKSKKSVLEPELYIFKRKKLNKYDLPFCYGELRVLDTNFIFIVPFTQKDRKCFVQESEFIAFKEFLKKIYDNYELYDFSNIKQQNLELQTD